MPSTQLAVPGEFLDAQELPPPDFLQEIDYTVSRFSGPVPHHTHPVPNKRLPKALLNSEFVLCVKILFPSLFEDYTKLLTGKINISTSSWFQAG